MIGSVTKTVVTNMPIQRFLEQHRHIATHLTREPHPYVNTNSPAAEEFVSLTYWLLATFAKYHI